MKRTHGESRLNITTEYRIWSRMRARCRIRSCKDYPHYGGRGIKVCERWNDYAAFLEDMGRRASPLHTLERIDNNLDYSPDNCRWATRKEQANNRRPRTESFEEASVRSRKAWATRRAA